MWRYAIGTALLILAGCGSGTSPVDDYNTTKVTLPDGTVIRAEVMRRDADMMRGMMFRDALAEDRGMLFVHGSPGKYHYFMYQVKIPLDIVWTDTRKNIVEIAENVPPCTTAASKCPQYGGTKDAIVVLELAGGVAKRHGVKVGARIDF